MNDLSVLRSLLRYKTSKTLETKRSIEEPTTMFQLHQGTNTCFDCKSLFSSLGWINYMPINVSLSVLRV